MIHNRPFLILASIVDVVILVGVNGNSNRTLRPTGDTTFSSTGHSCGSDTGICHYSYKSGVSFVKEHGVCDKSEQNCDRKIFPLNKTASVGVSNGLHWLSSS